MALADLAEETLRRAYDEAEALGQPAIAGARVGEGRDGLAVSPAVEDAGQAAQQEPIADPVVILPGELLGREAKAGGRGGAQACDESGAGGSGHRCPRRHRFPKVERLVQIAFGREKTSAARRSANSSSSRRFGLMATYPVNISGWSRSACTTSDPPSE